MRLFVLGFTFVAYVCQVALAQTEGQSGSQSDVIEMGVFSVGSIMNFVSAQKRRVMPDTCPSESCVGNLEMPGRPLG